MGGRISVESVVRCSWNGWPDDRGIRSVIKQWDDIRRIQVFFRDVENSTSNLPDAARCIAMDKLTQARELVGELDALKALLEWKGPQER